MTNALHRWLVLLLMVGAASLSACGAEDAGAWIRAAAEDSAAADEALAEGRPEEARTRLESLLARTPSDAVAAEDSRVVRQDAHERLARIALVARDLSEAERQVASGLALGARQDLFTGNLYTTRGQLREAQGRDREASEDYHRALLISEALLEGALGGNDD